MGWIAFEAPLYWRGWVLLVIIYPIVEEYVFRGLFMGFLAKYDRENSWAQVSKSNFFTSCCFSGAHALTQSWLMGFAVFLPSLWLGWVREKTNAIFLCALIHMSWNFGFFGATALAHL